MGSVAAWLEPARVWGPDIVGGSFTCCTMVSLPSFIFFITCKVLLKSMNIIIISYFLPRNLYCSDDVELIFVYSMFCRHVFWGFRGQGAVWDAPVLGQCCPVLRAHCSAPVCSRAGRLQLMAEVLGSLPQVWHSWMAF